MGQRGRGVGPRGAGRRRACPPPAPAAGRRPIWRASSSDKPSQWAGWSGSCCALRVTRQPSLERQTSHQAAQRPGCSVTRWVSARLEPFGPAGRTDASCNAKPRSSNQTSARAMIASVAAWKAGGGSLSARRVELCAQRGGSTRNLTNNKKREQEHETRGLGRQAGTEFKCVSNASPHQSEDSGGAPCTRLV